MPIVIMLLHPGSTSIDLVVWGAGSQLGVGAGSAVYHTPHPGQPLLRLLPAPTSSPAAHVIYGVPDLMYQGENRLFFQI